jgi:hypothetical protein
MATNTTPIYSSAAQVSWNPAVLLTANTAKDGTGVVSSIFTAGADGARVERIRAKALGTNVATVLRIFINNGGATSVAANNVLYAEVTLPATTLSESASLLQIELPNITDTTAFPIVLPAGYVLTATIGTTVAAGYDVIAVGSTYTV